MSIESSLAVVLRQNLLPADLFERFIDLQQTSVVLNDGRPVFVRIALRELGYIDLRVPDEGKSIALVAIGTGKGEIRSLAAIYPKSFDGKVTTRPILSEEVKKWVPERFRSWTGRIGDLFGGDPFAEGNVRWFETNMPLTSAPVNLNWCVPVAMSKLAPLAYGEPRLPPYFAERWGQRPTEPFIEDKWFSDTTGHLATSYEHLCNECFSTQAFVESLSWWGQLRCVTHDWLEKLGSATLFAERDHAEIAYAANTIQVGGVSIPGYTVVTSTDFGTAWRAYPSDEDLLLRFAFTVKPKV
jgi:hypothetical protein